MIYAVEKLKINSKLSAKLYNQVMKDRKEFVLAYKYDLMKLNKEQKMKTS
jgi:hypothetical protein